MDRESEPQINHHKRLPLRRISSEAHLIKQGADLKGRPYGLKNDSFYINDPYLLRTIFDDAKEIIASFDLERHYRPVKGATIHVINELKVEEDSSSDDINPKPSTPEEKRDFVRHRSTSDSSSSIPTATSMPIEEPKIPSIYELKTRRSQSIDINDVQDLTKVMKKAKSFKEYIEESYYELFTYILARQEREERLMQTAWKSTFEKETMIREHRKRETILLRSRRLCGRLQDFEILKKVGKGAFGDVFLARRRKTGELLALKRIHKSKLENKNQIANIKAEQDVLAEASNQWLVQMYYNFQDSEYVYFAMEFIQGGNVRTLLENTGSVGEDEARFYVAEMLVAVDVLHQLGYIHRDLKPDNFLIDKDGHVKLIDFGLSTKGVADTYREPFKGQLPVVKFSPPSTTARREEFRKQRKAHYSLVGSPDYMAFEILAEAGYDFSADWWSLGCILFELLVGFPPFTAGTAREVFSNVMNFNSVLENPRFEDQEEPLIGPEAWDLIQRLICSPDKRLGRESINEIKKHPFFAKIDWSHIRKMEPPFKPELSGPEDTSYFEYVEDVSAEDRRTLDPSSFLKKIQSLPKGILLAREAPDISYFAKPAIEPPPEETPRSPVQRRMSASILSSRKNSLPKSSDSIFNKLKRTSPTGSVALRTSGGNSPSRSASPSKGGSWNETFSNLVLSRLNKPRNSMLFEHPSTAQLSDRDWKVLCTGAIRLSYKQGDIILKEGQRNSCLYRIKSGQVRVEKSKSMVLGYLHKNQVFGEMAFVEDSIPDPRNADNGNVDASIIVDSETVELYKIERSFICSLFATDKELFARFYYVIAYVLAQRVMELPLVTFSEKRSKQLVLPHHDKLRTSLDPGNSPESPINVDKNKQKQDAQFRRKFHLTSNEVLIRKYKCILLGKRKLHGKLYIGKKHICFLGRIFGFSQKEIIYMQTVTGVKCIDTDQISITTSGIQYDFTGFESRDETFLLLEQLYTNFSEKLENEMGEDFHDSSAMRMRRRSSVGIMSNEFQNDIAVFENYYMKDLSLTQEDWGNILQKAECFHISKEEIILSQGEEEENLYQIASGSCKMERYDAQTEKTETVGHYQEREMFGETGFLLKHPSAVTIIADEDDVEIYKVEKASLEAMFQMYPGLAGKFYKFLSLMIARRIRQREMEILRLQTPKINSPK